MKANQPVVSTFSRPLNRNQANRTDPNLRQFPNNSYIPFDATFSPLPTRWNSKLWQSRNESLTRFEPWLSIVSHRPTIHYTSPLCLQLFENSSLHHETEHCLTTFPRSLVKHIKFPLTDPLVMNEVTMITFLPIQLLITLHLITIYIDAYKVRETFHFHSGVVFAVDSWKKVVCATRYVYCWQVERGNCGTTSSQRSTRATCSTRLAPPTGRFVAKETTVNS